MADHHPTAQGEFGVDAAAIDRVGLGMDLADEVGEHRVADEAFRRCALELLVVARHRAPGTLSEPESVPRPSFRWTRTDFGLVCSFNSSIARWVTGQLGLKGGDALPGLHEFSVFGGAEPWSCLRQL